MTEIGSSKGLSRKDFGKVAGLGMSSLVMLTNPLLNEISKQIEDANFKLPIDFRSGDHFLHEEDIDHKRHFMILGETRESDLELYNQGPQPGESLVEVPSLELFFESFVYKGIDGLISKQLNDDFLVRSLRSKNIHFASTDNLQVITFVDDKLDYLYSRSADLNGQLSLTGLGALFLHLIRSGYIYRKKEDPLPEMLIHGSAMYAEYNYLDEALRLFTRPIDKMISFLQVDIRNRVMCYNTKLIELLLIKNRDLRNKVVQNDEKVLMYFGNGHSEIPSEYRKSLDDTQKLLKKSSEFIIENTIKAMNGDLSDKEKEIFNSEDSFLNFFVVLASRFSYPICSFYNLPEYLNGEYSYIFDETPDSPRLILWKVLVDKFVKSSDTKEKQIIGKLIGALAFEDSNHFTNDNVDKKPERNAMRQRFFNNFDDRALSKGLNLAELLKGVRDFGVDKPTLFVFEGIPFVFNLR